MALYERAKKILVSAGNNSFAIVRNINRVRRRQRHCTIYLHIILKREEYEKRHIKINNVGYLNWFFDSLSAICLAMGRNSISGSWINGYNFKCLK